MATVDKRIGTNGSITWRARVRVKGQIRVATFKRKTDATMWAGKVESDVYHDVNGLCRMCGRSRIHNHSVWPGPVICKNRAGKR